MTPTRLKSPPIAEALIDLRVELPANVRTEDLARFHQAISSTYPESKKHIAFSGSFGVGPDGNAQVNVPPPQHTGYMCWSADRLQAAQARLDGFTLNRLHPYTHWEQFSAEARALWSEYLRVATPVAVVRVAVRYINRIELPPNADIKEYFRTFPVIPTELPQILAGLLLRLEVPVQAGRTAVITMAAEHAAPGVARTVILDIDVMHLGRFEPSAPEIWTVLEELRALKNRVFFESLTPKALGAYA